MYIHIYIYNVCSGIYSISPPIRHTYSIKVNKFNDAYNSK